MDKIDFQEIAYGCPENISEPHDWMPISFQKTERSKHVSELMCKRCFLTLPMIRIMKDRKINSE